MTREWTTRKESAWTKGLNCRVYAYAALRGLVRNYRMNLDLGADKLAEVSMKTKAKAATPAEPKTEQQQQVAPRVRGVRSRGIE